MSRRRKLRDSEKRYVWTQTSGLCALCGTALLLLHVHHIRFVSLGGSDDPENLAAMCPNCHLGVAHRLLRTEREGLVRLAVERSRWLATGEAVLLGAHGQLPSVEPLLSDEWRLVAMLSASYQRTLAWCQRFLEGPPPTGLSGQLERLTLVTLAAEMELRLSRNTPYLRKLSTMVSNTPRTPATATVLQRSSLSLSEQLRERRQFDRAEEVLALACENTEGEREFRSVALSLASDGSRLSSTTLRGSGAASPSLIADLGRQKLADGDLESAYLLLRQSAIESLSNMHRRGLMLTALKLCEVSLTLGEIKLAADWYWFASGFQESGIAHEVSPSALRRQILDNGGEGNLFKASSPI